MAVMWTDDQKSVLDVRDKNVLVSAAAGSGKTAVLVERIIRRVAEDSMDIDRLLVVTFTNAAAGEMRERILRALEKRAREEQSNEHLKKQLSYIHNASITTIDSFCLNIVRQYFNVIDADPSFTVGDEGELKLICEDVMKELLERYYQEGREEFLEFVDDYSGSRSDDKIEELISRMYQFSMSYPQPEEWLDGNAAQYDMEDGIENKNWYIYIKQEIEEILGYALEQTERAIELAQSEDGPFTYAEALNSDREFLMSLSAQPDYEKRVELLGSFRAAALSRKKLPDTTDEGKKEQIKAVRDSVKKEIKNLKSKYYTFSSDTISGDMEKCRAHVRMLVELTKEFIRMYGEAKREKNIVDFNDMEHMALDILTRTDDSGALVPTDIASEVAEDIDEIMIDEYQDSNLVQETILNAVSGMSSGKNNIFMVGDVKQSIYKFRLARPELFLEKYDSYPTDNNHDTRRITLSKNFRSRREVIDGANLVFGQIMSKELGGIEYDKDNALYTGADYADTGADTSVEVLMLDIKEYDGGSDEPENRELEAAMVADRIKQLIDSHYQVTDKASGGTRDIRYSDIAILLRSFSSYGEIYDDVLSENGIPVRSQTGTGYFDTFEVVTVLNMLSVIDNPRQDIPLGGVMKNMFSFSDEELAVIRSKAKSAACFWECVKAGSDEKVKAFVKTVERYREMVPYTSIHDMIEDILKYTGFGYFAAAMKAGSVRTANLEMLKEKAVAFENTSFSGLFNFVRYIEKLKKYNVEQTEAGGSGGGDFVTLMTIHKSKGLEFPVVIIGAMCKPFNKMDTRGDIVLHHELGAGLNYMDRKSGIKANTLIKASISRRIEKESIAEELRVFYVAFTRAKEKLILAGNGNIYAKIKKYISLRNERQQKISPVTVFKAADYMEWIIMSLMRHKAFSSVLKSMGESVPFAGALFEHPASYDVSIVTPEQIMDRRVREEITAQNERSVYLHWDAEHIYDEALRDRIYQMYSYAYPYENDRELGAKVSVSDIKHMFMKLYDDDTDTGASELSGFETDEKPVPSFVAGERKMSGTMRGTAYHRVFELLDFGRFYGISSDRDTEAEIRRQIEAMRSRGAAPDEYFEVTDIKKVAALISSDTGIRMAGACAAGKLYREKQFVTGITADCVRPEYSKEERVLVQGIVDAYFEEDGELVIVDYKTDNVVNIKDLYARYKAQLDYYAMALSSITGKRVKEKILYSVKLNREYIYN